MVLTGGRLQIIAPLGADPVDHIAHHPFVVGGQVASPLLQNGQHVTAGVAAGVVGELLGVLVRGTDP